MRSATARWFILRVCLFCSPRGNDKVIYLVAMTRPATFTIAAVAFLCSAAANSPPVTFESPCECRDAHGKARLAVKNDAALRRKLAGMARFFFSGVAPLARSYRSVLRLYCIGARKPDRFFWWTGFTA
jgi:hypothetical protein